MTPAALFADRMGLGAAVKALSLGLAAAGAVFGRRCGGVPKSVLLIPTSTQEGGPRDHRLRHPLSRTLRAG